jgi:hypothetical protein
MLRFQSLSVSAAMQPRLELLFFHIDYLRWTTIVVAKIGQVHR